MLFIWRKQNFSGMSTAKIIDVRISFGIIMNTLPNFPAQAGDQKHCHCQ